MDNQDAEKLKIENIIRDGINPRIKIDIRFIEKFENLILIIKVYKSWLSPHRVIYSAYSKNFNQFYARSSAGKYQLDINELRSAFNLSETIIEKINTFKVQRIMDMV
ncbi:MAG: helix-turn-helix domain-containing protein [Patescibacteria group bacterium]